MVVAQRVLGVALLCTLVLTAPLPGIKRSDKQLGKRDLFDYRSTMVAWYCAGGNHSRTAPCIKKRTLDGLHRRPLAEYDIATSDALESISMAFNRGQAKKEYADMFKHYCNSDHDDVDTRDVICANAVFRRAYG